MRGNNMLRFLKNLALWFVALGFSLLVSNVFDLLEQGKAFFYAIYHFITFAQCLNLKIYNVD